ncbi:MAG: RNA methyltransferase [Candidatus Latescibacterota bacterium]|nr:RNA methyltransferase [Candidatus Latescibacterota bacterium]
MSKTRALHAASLRGLGGVTRRELEHLFGTRVEPTGSEQSRNLDLTLFRYRGNPTDLYDLGTAEDLFVTIAELKLSGTHRDLDAYRKAALRHEVGEALEVAGTLRRRTGKRVSYRVVVQAQDTPGRAYRRNEIEGSVEEGLTTQYRNWKLVEDDADLEFWVQQLDRKALFGLRLSDASMRHRTYKVAHMPGSLRPTVARAMAFLAGWSPDDVVVDPTCGVGTLLVERAMMTRHAGLLGGDLSVEAAGMALANFGLRHRPRAICRWDATRLPLSDRSVRRVIANLPWDHRIQADVEELYGPILSETSRVLGSGGTAVLLTSRAGALQDRLRDVSRLCLRERIRKVSVLGRSADLFVLAASD